MATNQNNILDFEDPSMLSEELMNVPGFVNELMCYTLAVSPRPNKPLALLWALSENPTNPVITGEAIEWGAKVVTHLTKRMLYMAQFYVAEG